MGSQGKEFAEIRHDLHEQLALPDTRLLTVATLVKGYPDISLKSFVSANTQIGGKNIYIYRRQVPLGTGL